MEVGQREKRQVEADIENQETLLLLLSILTSQDGGAQRPGCHLSVCYSPYPKHQALSYLLLCSHVPAQPSLDFYREAL